MHREGGVVGDGGVDAGLEGAGDAEELGCVFGVVGDVAQDRGLTVSTITVGAARESGRPHR